MYAGDIVYGSNIAIKESVAALETTNKVYLSYFQTHIQDMHCIHWQTQKKRTHKALVQSSPKQRRQRQNLICYFFLSQVNVNTPITIRWRVILNTRYRVILNV